MKATELKESYALLGPARAATTAEQVRFLSRDDLPEGISYPDWGAPTIVPDWPTKDNPHRLLGMVHRKSLSSR
jgi:hypothetical protein